MSLIRRAVLAAVLSALTNAAHAAVTGVVDPPLSPRNANYTIAAPLDPATRTITGSETIAWRNITGAAGDRAAVPPVLERLEEHRIDVHARARARRRIDDEPRAPQTSGARIDVTADRRSLRTSISPRAKRFIAPDDGNPDDRDGDGCPAAAADRAGRERDDRGRVDRARAAHRSRAPAPSATSSSSRSGSRSSACCRTRAGTATSSMPAPSSSPTSASTTSR